MGTFTDLRNGSGSYARALVQNFGDFHLPDSESTEVPAYELDRFIGYVRQRAFQ